MSLNARRTAGLVLLSVLCAPALGRAQEVALPEPIEADTKPGDGKDPEIALDVDREIDLANVVTSAAKRVTTVQEAPAIITIITDEEIRARGLRYLGEALSTVPGWLDTKALGGQVPNPLVRGVGQAVLLLRDGLSLFDPWGNIAWTGRTQPLETTKRIEVVTGPGGVLWGANSYLGVVNLISKDADDLNGFEASAGYGDGAGNKQDIKAYAMFGKSFLNGKLKIFQHVSYESYLGEVYNIPQLVVLSPAPQPGGLAFFGPNSPRDPARSWQVIVDGRYSYGPLTLYYMIPFGDTHPNLTFGSAVVSNDLWSTYDRYVMLEYKDRFAKNRLGLVAKGYGVQFIRDFTPQLFPASSFFKNPAGTDDNHGGLNFSFAGQKIFRAGGTLDLDLNLPFDIRLLGGGEFFYESIRDSVFRANQPSNVADLPLLCPIAADGTPVPNCPRQYIADTGRFVVAGYFDAVWRIANRLTIDGGIRLQAGLGDLPYALVPIGSAAAVWNFLPDFHLKVNYAGGFRAPVFLNTSVIAGGIGYGANSRLRPEGSQSFQGELNARLLRNVRKVRELEVRVDYSYTVLSDIIQIHGGQYNNTGKRAIHSAEAYAKLYLNGGHFLQAAYTFLYANTTDSGVIRAVPNHWFIAGGSFNIVKNLLDLNINLKVFGAYEDPNRVATQPGGGLGTTTAARASDLTFDRLTPVADVQLGLRLRFLKDKLQITAQFYNIFDQHYYYPDNFYDLTPTIEVWPNPAPGFNFWSSISYRL